MEQSKTGTVVRIPLGRMAMSLLPHEDLDIHVFRLPTPTAVQLSCKWIAEKAGIKKNVSFHTSRHTFATLTISACGDLSTVSRLLGHKDLKTTQIYADVMMENRISAVNAAL